MDSVDMARKVFVPQLPNKSELILNDWLAPENEVAALKDSGIAYVILVKNQLHQEYAVKKVYTRFIGQFLEKEAELLKTAYAKGVNVPLCLGIRKEENSETRTMLMSYTPGGDLGADGKLASLPLEERYKIVKRLVAQVCSLHQAGISHNDLNIGNFLWYENDVQLIDFGAAAYDEGNHAKDLNKVACEIIKILTLKYPTSIVENYPAVFSLPLDEINNAESCLKTIGVEPGSMVSDLQKMMRSEISMEEIRDRSWLNFGD